MVFPTSNIIGTTYQSIAGFRIGTGTGVRFDAGSIYLGNDYICRIEGNKVYNTTPYTKFNVQVAGFTCTNTYKPGQGSFQMNFVTDSVSINGDWNNYTGNLSINITNVNVNQKIGFEFSAYYINHAGNGKTTGTLYRVWFS